MLIQLNEANTSMVRLVKYNMVPNRFTAVHGGRAMRSTVVLEKEKTHQSSVNINNLQEK